MRLPLQAAKVGMPDLGRLGQAFANRTSVFVRCLRTDQSGVAHTMYHRVKLLGGPVDLVSQTEVIEFVAEAVTNGRKAVVGNQNFHSLVMSRTNPDLRAFFAAADLIEIDSMPLLHWGRLLGLQLSRRHRSTYLDWRDEFWRVGAQVGWRVFLLGATQAVNARASITPGCGVARSYIRRPSWIFRPYAWVL